ncbi:MAG: carboxypeptidase regulatory-like domain-containing protein [Gemmatimonadetes bacterium]|nr:carboxypeptidase regulatory-like domain-containing protein [Gemmatimonadota bacterium]
MNRIKLLAAAALLAVPLVNACGDPTPPLALGSIGGQVVIEGEQQAGVTVKLNTGATATTTSTGSFSFADVEAGTYTVTISGFAEDGSFDETDQSATIANDGQKVTVNFTGSWIRTSSIDGEVTVEGAGLEGVIVKLTGMSEAETTTSAIGAYSFPGLRAGIHTVEISGFDDDDIGFPATSAVAEVAVGETEELDFQGSYLRTSAVMGQVTVDGEGLAGVTVSLQGVDRDLEVGTNSGGQFSFTELRKGDYAIAISGYDTDEYGFAVTSRNVTVARAETADVPFDGIALRTAAVSGAVTIEGTGLEGVTVSLTGEGADLSVVTDAAGQWAFTRLHAGSYSVGISGYDTDEYGFGETSASVTVALRETATVDFDGIELRTAAISGQVSIEGDPLASVTVTISGGRADEVVTAITDVEGAYSADHLHAGDYTVAISGFDTDEYEFELASQSISVGLRETADIGFDGIVLRTVEIMGTVTTDGEPLAGATVTVSGGRADEVVTALTDAAGAYSLDRLHAGDYMVAISGFDTEEYEFEAASRSISVELGEMANVDFAGAKLRTVEIFGTVAAEGEALGGVTVTISGGRADETLAALTDAEGTYSLDRLHAGEYTITVSGFDADEYEFDSPSQTIMVELGEVAEVDFPGVKLRTVGIYGTVAAEGEPLADVTVTVSGGRADETVTALTDAAGAFSLDRLHAGDYTVAISGYERGFEFDPAERSIRVELREMAEVLFEHGIPLRTASISGRVTLDGDPADNITIALSGAHDAEMETNADGQYDFPGLAAGDYTLELSGFDPEGYEYAPESVDVTLMPGERRTEYFAGRSLRTVVITGSVTAEGEMIAGANASLFRVATPTKIVPVMGGTQITDDNGEFTFGGLLDDTYAVLITGHDDEYDFPKIPLAGQEFVAWSGYVATDDTATINFVGAIVRTAVIGGEVTADGDPVVDVEVVIEGEHAPDDNATVTDADGKYAFDGLRKGDYTISIANPDEKVYDFQTTEREIRVAVGQEQDDVSFAGSMLRSISGQVHVEGHPLEGVTVMLSGDDEGSAVTDGDGKYIFDGLRKGDYTVSIANPDADRYVFEVTEVTVDGRDSDEAEIVDFSGEHVRDASISGTLFLDEVDKNGDRGDGEPVFAGAAATMAKLILEDEGGGAWHASATAEGSYEFTDLKAGTYTLRHDTASNGDLYNAGYGFAGDSAGVSVELTGTSEETVDLPYEITKQTINIGAVMANGTVTTTTGVEGVAYQVYPNLAAAREGRDALGSGTTAASGTAAVTFARANDYGPGGPGTPTDGVVIVEVDPDRSDYHDDLLILDPTGRFEAVFEFTERTTDATKTIGLVNTASHFRWSVMSADREVGGKPLAGWKATVIGGAAAVSVAAGRNGSATTGEASIPVAEIPREYTVVLDAEGQPDATGEEWESSGTLSYTHTGLDLPDAAVADIGAISINWTTQSLYFGFYREVDGRPGFTDSWVGGDVPLDHRPVGDHLEDDVSWTFRSPDGAGRYATFEWDHDGDPDTEDVGADDAAEWVNDWLVRFPRIPTDTELEINLTDIGTDKSHYAGPKEIDAFGIGLTRGVRNADGVFNTFGADGGGHPEMWLCGESSGDITPDNGHDECVTHGYQWTNNQVTGAFWPRTYTGRPYEEDEELEEAMTVTLEGVSPTANVESSIATDKDFEWDEVNDGVYTLKSTQTERYGLDSASYSYSGDPHGEGEEIDATYYLETLYVFYQERDDGQRDQGEYERETIFKVTDIVPVLATLKNLTVDGDTVPGFEAGDPDGSSYEMTVGWDRDSIEIAAEVDSRAEVSGDIGWVQLRAAGHTSTFSVTGTAEAGDSTATYTIDIFRTTDRVKVTDEDGELIDAVEVKEGGDAVKLGVSLWADPTTGNDVTVVFRDSSWTFTSTDHDTKAYDLVHAEDDDGENEDSTFTITASGGDVGHAGSGTIAVTFVDNDIKQFVGPTEISAIEGVEADINGENYRSPVVTTLSTEPTAVVNLVIAPTSGGDADLSSLDIDAASWNTGAVFNVFGDVDGNDFDIAVDASGGGYDEVDYPDIAVNWLDNTDHRLVVQTQAANVVPGRAYATRVVLWRRDAVDDQARTILDNAVVFDSLDLALGCPKEWTCLFNDGTGGATVSLDQTTYSLNVNVTPPDAANAGEYEVTFIAMEQDDINDNGHFIGDDEVEYAIRFTVLDTEK